MNLKTICILLTALLILVNPVFNIVEAQTDTSSYLGSKSLAVGESWDMGNGWVLTAQSIDARARSVWLVLSRDGSEVDNKVVNLGQVYSWNNIFSTKISGVYAGATSDTVSLTDTYLTVITPLPTSTIVEARTDTSSYLGSKKLAVGESWDMGDGWVLTAQSIDATGSPRQVWLVLSRDGSEVDNKVATLGEVYSWNNIFSTKISSIYAGATSDAVSLTDTYLNKETTPEMLSLSPEARERVGRWFRPLLGYAPGEKAGAAISSHGYPMFSFLSDYSKQAGTDFVIRQGSDGNVYLINTDTNAQVLFEGAGVHQGEQIVFPLLNGGTFTASKSPGSKGFSGRIKGLEDVLTSSSVDIVTNPKTGDEWLAPKMNVKESAIEGQKNATIVIERNGEVVGTVPFVVDIQPVSEGSATNKTSSGVGILIDLIAIAAVGYYFLKMRKKSK